jgi:hypothetical protein
MHVDAGGICDCYNFWGYGHFPTCDEVSYPDSIINLMFLTIIPYMIMALGVIFTTKAIWELHRCDQFKMNVVGRGLLLNGLAAFFGTFWCVSCGLSIFSPIVDRRQWSTYYLFNMGMGSYTAVFVPAFLVLPICWIENVMASKKMKKKVNFQVPTPPLFFPPAPRHAHTQLPAVPDHPARLLRGRVPDHRGPAGDARVPHLQRGRLLLPHCLRGSLLPCCGGDHQVSDAPQQLTCKHKFHEVPWNMPADDVPLGRDDRVGDALDHARRLLHIC